MIDLSMSSKFRSLDLCVLSDYILSTTASDLDKLDIPTTDKIISEVQYTLSLSPQSHPDRSGWLYILAMSHR
jgi:hypothetical protein